MTQDGAIKSKVIECEVQENGIIRGNLRGEDGWIIGRLSADVRFEDVAPRPRPDAGEEVGEWRTDMPEYDGSYLCHIRKEQECGNFWLYHRVVENKNNLWVVDVGEEILGWQKLPPA